VTPEESMDILLTFDELIMGFKKWPEHTATSLSGCDLRTYKSMIKDLPKKDDHKQTPPKYLPRNTHHALYLCPITVISQTHPHIQQVIGYLEYVYQKRILDTSNSTD